MTLSQHRNDRLLWKPTSRSASWDAPLLDWSMMDATEHFVQFYEADAFLLDAVAQFIGTALTDGEAGIMIATKAHREGVIQRLHTQGVDVGAACLSGQFTEIDAFGTLTRFMVDGAPDVARFNAVVGGIIARAVRDYPRVRIFGGMVALLAADGNFDATLRLEDLWNDLREKQSFTLFCAYPMDHSGGEAITELYDRVSAAHTSVIPAESYAALATSDDRLRAIVALQQKARWLESEIVERKRAEEQMRVALAAERMARQEAEDALRLRNEFLSIAAHELKTPLTGLAGRAQLTLRYLRRTDELDSGRVVRALESITEQADKLTRLLNQLLDVSRFESGKLLLERQLSDLTTLLRQIVADVRPTTSQHTLSLAVPSSLLASIDPLRLEQVVRNLLDNAIKYSPNGGPIDVELRQTHDGNVELSITDCGIGIPEEQRGQIFERFYQVHGNGHASGLGLGLFVSRQIVELHGGQIHAESPPAGGTRFVVQLPIVALDQPTSHAAD
jgi:signal transduction histidine kinase